MDNRRPSKHNGDDAPETLIDWIAFAALGGLTGAVYGAILAALVYVVSGVVHANLIGISAGVVGALGLFFGNFIGELAIALTHFVAGLMFGLTETWPPDDGNERAGGYLRAFMLLGFATGLVFAIWIWHMRHR